MKDYYDILKVEKNATTKDIKKSYRRLAVLHHPDKSGLSKSELFHEINEAYQILSNKEKKEAYDWEMEFGDKSSSRKIDFGNFYTASNKAQPYQKYARAVSIVSLLFCIVLALDYFLPPKEAIETVNKIEKKQIIAEGLFTEEGDPYTAQIYTSSFKIPISSEIISSFPPGGEIKIYRTRIFSIYTKIERKLKGLTFTTRPDYSIYTIFIFLPIVLFICSVLGTFYQRQFNPDMNFSLGIVNFMLLIITFVITLV